ncbi:MAG: carbohydrate-binding domain-containing protein [Bacillales bacterium]|nr:carbohydrate-binding domain-containing protein [Bacillales bacterium]
MKKTILLGVFSAVFAFSLMGCTAETTTNAFLGSTTPSTEDTASETDTTESTTITTKDLTDYTVIDLSALLDDETITIDESGKYAIIGTASNAQVVIDGEDISVEVALDSASLTYLGEEAAFYVKEAGSFTLEIVSGTTNYIENSENNLTDGAIVVKKTDFNITGGGTLVLNGKGLSTDEIESGAALYTSKNLIMDSGTIIVEAANDHAISAKTGVTITGGTIEVESASGDGMHSKSGDIVLSNMTYTSNTLGDGIDAGGDVKISSGNYNIMTNGTFVLYDASQDSDGTLYEDAKFIKSGTTYMRISKDSLSKYTYKYYLEQSVKGIKSDSLIEITGGSFTVDADDDAIHSNGDVQIYAGSFTLNTLDDGIHAEYFLQLGGSETTSLSNDFTVTVESCYEGIEGMKIEIYDGIINVVSSDDGINAAGGADSDTEVSDDMYLHFGGDPLVIVNASGDGLDANGNISMYGGTVYVFGPTDNSNGALDYDGNFYITGGTLVAVGSSGMAQVPDNPTQYVIAASFTSSSLTKGSTVYVGGSDYSIAVSLPKNYSSSFAIVISSPSIKKGNTYTIKCGGTYSGSFSNGVSYSGSYSSGTTITSLTISDLLTTYGSIGIGGSNSGSTIGSGGTPGSNGGEGGIPGSGAGGH